ncbi:polysaccharide biosynthesis tyrosine autokinase [Arthrobacter sp. SDTb3-6]|uniref:polysaccharide biosynthesis tyrosine autokinase n=1 Tax=Arthrobacter sp. SDTb3-6 TaxID=2713571 RepID=UPI00159DF08E|nr:polysaccharide biosynthesis tyrosine autokinase [Arthrobacter sp. SDTb3-6]NVN00092.1 polysaccharide biosynthesis tyrosine autokinase [Arthrobacter sp. SDTb3-6]
MELQDYIRILRRNWLTIVAIGLIGLLAGGAFSVLSKPVYTAETQLFVATQNSGSVQDLQTGNSFIQARVSSYVVTATTPTVLQPVIDTLGLDVSPQQLSKTIKATSDLKTVLITISVDDGSPVQAAAIAHAVASSLITAVDKLEKPADGGPSPVKLSVVTPATAPAAPSSPNLKINLALGLIVGLALGIGAALLRTTLDTRVRSERDLQQITQAPVLGGIAFDADASKSPLVTEGSTHSQRAESFRQLRTNLQFAHVSHKSKTVLVTSSLPGEGKSTTATNLAIAMAESGQTVALVDADLRRPMVATYLGLESRAGLTTALIGQADVKDLMQPWGRNELHVLTSGRIPPNPSELLGSAEMKQLILRLEQAFDAVVIDAPPLLPVTDAAVLAQQVGGVVLVVGCHATKQPQVEKAIATLELVDADLLGVVLNRLPVKGPDAYAYSYYGYAPKIEQSPQPARRSAAAPIQVDTPGDAFDDILQGRTTRRG